MCSSFIEVVESVVEDVDCCRLLCTLESSCFVVAVEAVESVVEAVESAGVKAVDCCRLFCALESSSFVKAVESVVIILKLLSLLMLKLLIVVGYYVL